MLRIYFIVFLAYERIADHMLLKDAKRLPETHRNSLLVLCYLLVSLQEIIWSRQDALTPGPGCTKDG